MLIKIINGKVIKIWSCGFQALQVLELFKLALMQEILFMTDLNPCHCSVVYTSASHSGALIQSLSSPCWICGEQSSSGVCFSPGMT